MAAAATFFAPTPMHSFNCRLLFRPAPSLTGLCRHWAQPRRHLATVRQPAELSGPLAAGAAQAWPTSTGLPCSLIACTHIGTPSPARQALPSRQPAISPQPTGRWVAPGPGTPSSLGRGAQQGLERSAWGPPDSGGSGGAGGCRRGRERAARLALQHSRALGS